MLGLVRMTLPQRPDLDVLGVPLDALLTTQCGPRKQQYFFAEQNRPMTV